VGACYRDFDVLLVDSGTSALTLAIDMALLRAAQPSTPRLVAVPAFSCPDVATATIGARARLVLYDLDPHTLEPDWDSLRLAFEQGAKVAVVTHLYGRVVDLAPAQALANEFGAIVVEDAAQHAGGTVHGRRGGSQASLGVLSFGRGKGLNAGGGGALLCRRSDNWAELDAAGDANGLVALLLASAAELLSHPVVYGVPAGIPALGVGSTSYRPPRAVSPLSAACAVLLAAALQREAMELAARRKRESTYLDVLLARAPGRVAVPSHATESGALRTPVFLDPSLAGNTRALHALGVVRSYPRALNAYRELASSIVSIGGALIGSEWLAARTHTLPTHRLVRDKDATAILGLLASD
jgi:dTDP-4-amino-4,6-dideoxygalactose transaminase